MRPLKLLLIASLCLVAVLFQACDNSPQGRARRSMERGREWLAKKSYKKALVEFRVAAQNAPTDPEPLYHQGLVLLAQKNLNLALTQFEKALKLRPAHAPTLYQMARVRFLSENPEILYDARTFLTRLREADPRNTPAICMLSMVNAKLGRLDEALENFDTALARPDAQLDDIRLPIGALVRRRNFAEARKFVARAVTSRSKSPDLLVTEAEIEFFDGHSDLAADLLSRALTLRTHFSPALQLRLRLESVAGDAVRAEATARELADVPDPKTRDILAQFLLASGRQEEALAEYRRLRKAFPDLQNVQDAYIGLLLQTRRRDEARTELKKVLNNDDPRPDLLVLRATLNLDENRLDDAAADLKALDLVAPSTDRGTYLKAKLAAARGDHMAAGGLFADTLRLNPRYFAARLDLVRVLVDAGRPDAALPYLEDTTDAERNNPEFLDYYLATLTTSGSWRDARRVVNEHLAKGETSQLRLFDASLRTHEGDLPGARRILDSLLAENPANTAALGVMAQVFKAAHQDETWPAWLTAFAARYTLNEPVQIYTATVLRNLQKVTQARAVLQRVSATGRSSKLAPELAALDLATGDAAHAKQTLLDSLSSGDDAYKQTLLADACARTGDWAGAEAHLRRANSLAPAEWLPVINLASVVSRDPNRAEEAVSLAQKAAGLSPGNAPLENSIGWVFFTLRRFEPAITHLQRSLDLQPTPAAYYHLAAACSQIGDKECAVTKYRAAFRLDPNAPERTEVSPFLSNLPR